MKTPRLESWYAGILLVIFGGIVLHAPLTVWLGTLLPSYAVMIKSWKEFLMVLAIGLAVLIVTRRRMWSPMLHDHLLQLITAFAALHLLLLPIKWTGLTASLAGLAIDLRYLLFFVLVYTCLKVAPRYKRLFLRVGIGGAVIVAVFAFLQVTVLPRDILAHIGYDKDTTIAPYLTVDENHDYVRINGTLRGPNPLGAYMVIVLSILASWLIARRREIKYHWLTVAILGVGGLAGLWASYSRSALVALAASLGLILLMTIARTFSVRHWILTVALVSAALGGLLVTKDSSFVSNIILHDDPGGGSSISSNEGHITSLIDGTNRMARQPLGAGVGSTGSASLYGESDGLIIENQYLFIAHEAGWLGLGVFLAIFSYVLYALWHRRRDWLGLGVFTSGIGLALVGLLLPVWVDDTVSIVWWGLTALVLSSRK
jgi:hypothetical protein